MLLSVGVALFAAVTVGWSTIAGAAQRSQFVNVLLVAMFGMNGAVLARDLFTLYVFLEITSVSSFILIAMNRDKDALESAFKYIVLSGRGDGADADRRGR